MPMEVAIEREVARIVKDALLAQFNGQFEIGPIDIEQKLDQAGDPYLHIRIVFDGDQTNLDPVWTSSLIGRIRPELIRLGVTNLPSKSFVAKSEWLALQR